MGSFPSRRVAAKSQPAAVKALPAPAPAPVAEEVKEPKVHKRQACRYGIECYQRNPGHLERYVHPGDRNYRNGLVLFKPGQTVQFQTLRQLFNFYDAEETGHLEQDEFDALFEKLKAFAADNSLGDMGDVAHAWALVASDGYASFARVTMWASDAGLSIPVGLDVQDVAPRICRFRLVSKDQRCTCVAYKESEAGYLCECGHKPSMHRSDAAEDAVSKMRAVPLNWDAGAEGLREVMDDGLLCQLQQLLDHTHKARDNWTRDRGCQLHGVGGAGCSLACASKHRIPVPVGYRLRKALRNQNLQLWQKYCIAKTAITEECGNESSEAQFAHTSVLSLHELDAPLSKDCNEWRLLHGSTMEACRGICMSGFRLSLSGTGATWKEGGQPVGTPLYGFGIYLAENVTKADEYSKEVPGDELTMLSVLKAISEPLEGDLFASLVVRVVGGRANVVTSNEIDRAKLRMDVFDGPYHSVFGDRVRSLGKPFREVVVYDKDQAFPEFLLLYERLYG